MIGLDPVVFNHGNTCSWKWRDTFGPPRLWYQEGGGGSQPSAPQLNNQEEHRDNVFCHEGKWTRQDVGAVGFGRPVRSGTSPDTTVQRPPPAQGALLVGDKRTRDDVFLTPPPFPFLHSPPLPAKMEYSRKVFIGGLPPDIDESEICQTFSRFGKVVVDWPHKDQTKAYFPPKGYAFLIFDKESSVHHLMANTTSRDRKHYINVSSPSVPKKPVQIRAWCLADTDYFTDGGMMLDARLTVFVGGVPRPLKASELGHLVNGLFGGVCYAGVDTDLELKYPKGAGRVTFDNKYSYMAAIASRFLQLKTPDLDKSVEVKPYVFDDQGCDECSCAHAPFFCPNMACLKYFCHPCWMRCHQEGGGRQSHKPLIKETTDRSTKGAMHRPFY